MGKVYKRNKLIIAIYISILSGILLVGFILCLVLYPINSVSLFSMTIFICFFPIPIISGNKQCKIIIKVDEKGLYFISSGKNINTFLWNDIRKIEYGGKKWLFNEKITIHTSDNCDYVNIFIKNYTDLFLDIYQHIQNNQAIIIDPTFYIRIKELMK